MHKTLLKEAITIDARSKKHELNQQTSCSYNEPTFISNILKHNELLDSESDDVSFCSDKGSNESDITDSTSILTKKNCCVYLSNESGSSFNSIKSNTIKNSSCNSQEYEIYANEDCCDSLSIITTEHQDFESDHESESETIIALGNDQRVDQVFQEFLEYVVSPNSGNRHLKPATLCVSNVKQILSVITGHKLDPLSLMDRKLVRDVFLKIHCKEKKMHSKTVQKYLKSLEHFFSFVQSENINKFELHKTELDGFKCKLAMWRHVYVKESKIVTMSRMEHERKTKITPQDIVTFENSKVVRDTIVEIGQLKDDGGKKKVS